MDHAETTHVPPMPGLSLHGPDVPYAESDAMTIRGLIALSRSKPKPSFGITRGLKLLSSRRATVRHCLRLWRVLCRCSLSYEIRLGDELFEEVDALRLRQVDGDAALVEVDAVVCPGPPRLQR